MSVLRRLSSPDDSFSDSPTSFNLALSTNGGEVRNSTGTGGSSPPLAPSANSLTEQLAKMSLCDSDGSQAVLNNVRTSTPRSFLQNVTNHPEGRTEAASPLLPHDTAVSKPGSIRGPLRPATSSDELQMTELTSHVAELSVQIQEVITTIFEIQEMRHTGSTARNGVSHPSDASTMSRDDATPALHSFSSINNTPSELSSSATSSSSQIPGSSVNHFDDALMKLEAKVESVRSDFQTLEVKMSLHSMCAVVDQDSKLASLQKRWTHVQNLWNDAQRDADLLSEELKEDKWLVVFRTVSQQAGDMMDGLEKVVLQSRQFAYDLDSREVSDDVHGSQPLINSFQAMQNSLAAKVKYYSPACDRVLRILGKGITDRSTKNGEVLRRYAEMQTRWQDLRSMIELAREETTKAAHRLAQTTAPHSETNEESPSKTVFRSNLEAMNRTPMKAFAKSPYSALSRSNPASHDSPSYPPRSSRKSLAKATGIPSSFDLLSPPSRGPPSRRSSMSRSTASSGLDASSSRSSRLVNDRSSSPTPSIDGIETPKPRWNISTRPTEDRQAAADGTNSRRLSYTPNRDTASQRSYSVRSSSRLSMSGPLNKSISGAGSYCRAVSPTFSDASSSMLPKERPTTPGSKIPLPASVNRRRSSMQFLSQSASESIDNFRHTPKMMLPKEIDVDKRSEYGSPDSKTPANNSLFILGSSASSSHSEKPISDQRRISQRGDTGSAAHARRLNNSRMAADVPPIPPVPRKFRESMILPSTPQSRRPATPQSRRPPSSRPQSAMSRREPVHRASTPSLDVGETQYYTPNQLDPLDLHFASVVNSLPALLHVERLDPPLTRVEVARMETLQARYFIGLPVHTQQRAVNCKLVNKLGPRAAKGEKKVVVRKGTGWQDLELYCLSLCSVVEYPQNVL